MLTEMYFKKTFHMASIIRRYNVAKTISVVLIKTGLIKKGNNNGDYIWCGMVPDDAVVGCVLDEIVEYNHEKSKSRNKPASEVVEVSNAVGTAYPKNDLEKAISEHISNDKIESREQYALNILADIMRDNQHITYTLKRIEREVKETETTIL
jgi:hypothetical protein